MLEFSNSELFRRATNRAKPKLVHPTSSSFTPETWREALTGIKEPSTVDQNLTNAAIWFGGQIEFVRETLPSAFDGIGRSIGRVMLAAGMNRNYVSINSASNRRSEKLYKGKGFVNLSRSAEGLIENKFTGQKLSADEYMEAVVDAFPHFFYFLERGDYNRAKKPASDVQKKLPKIEQLISIELCLRDLWQRCLWEGWVIDDMETSVLMSPVNPTLDEHWTIAQYRQQIINNQQSMLDLVFLEHEETHLSMVNKFFFSRIDIENGKKRKICVSRWREEKQYVYDHMRMKSAENSHLSFLLKKNLDFFLPNKICIHTILRIWFALSGLSELLISALPQRRGVKDDKLLENFSLSVSKAELLSGLVQVTELPGDVVSSVVDFLTVPTEDFDTLFKRSCWSAPLLPSVFGDRYYLLAAPLLIGNLLKVMEWWLERAKVTDGGEAIGVSFEATVRNDLRSEIKKNKILKFADCPLVGLPSEIDGEQIDCIIYFGSTILIVEVKCFVTPTEPIDRFTFVNKLRDACDQVKRKEEWIRRNLINLKCLPEELKNRTDLNIVPVVVLNNVFGSGIGIFDVPVVDFNYFKLLFGSGRYVSGAAVNMEKGGEATQSIELYRTEKELEENISDLLKEPMPLRILKPQVSWSEVPFPEKDRRSFIMTRPHISVSDPTENLVHSVI